MYDEPVDADAAAARDEEFSLFYKQDLPRLVAFLMVHGASAATAAEVAQEAMVEVYRSWDHVDFPRAYVRTTAVRVLWRCVARERAEDLHGNVAEGGVLLSPDEAAEIDARHTFLSLLESLTATQRQVLAWSYDGYTPTEIAAILGKTPATVRAHLRDARRALRAQYGPGEVSAP